MPVLKRNPPQKRCLMLPSMKRSSPSRWETNMRHFPAQGVTANSANTWRTRKKTSRNNLEFKPLWQCHPSQYETLMSVNLKSKAKVEKATTTSRSPTFDKLMTPHWFYQRTRWAQISCLHGHGSSPGRSGLWGRFQLKTGRDITKTGKAWISLWIQARNYLRQLKQEYGLFHPAKPPTLFEMALYGWCPSGYGFEERGKSSRHGNG